MEKQLLITEVKKLTGRADLEQALQLLDDFTITDPKYDELHDQVVHAKAQYAQLQKDQNAGVISFENAKLSLNQVTQQILAILDELEKENTPVPKKTNRKKLIPLLFSALLMIILGVFGANWLMNQKGTTPSDPEPEPEKPQVVEITYCNNFNEKDADFRALILPYYYISEPLGSHDLVRLRLGNLRDQYLIKLESEIYSDSTLAHSSQYPANSDEAVALSKNCDVDVDLVIWGTEGKVGNQNFITTKYKFLVGKDSFDLTKLKISDTGIDTIQSLSSILTHGEVTGEIEQIIKYIFGLIKYETGDYDAAIAALEEVQLQEEDSSAQLTKDMLLFDSHYKRGDKIKAMASLDAALKTQPDFTLALNNRAAMYYEQKKYHIAANDLKEATKSLPEDVTIVSNLLQVNLTAENVIEAEKIYHELQQMKTGDKDLVARAPKVIENIKRTQEIQLKSTTDVLKRDPGNINALQRKAEIYLKQENFSAAIKLANQILKQNQKNKAAYIILLEAYIKLEREREVVATVRRAQNAGFNRTTLLEGREDLVKLVNKFTLKKK